MSTGMRPPHQSRSRETMNRILAAAAVILETKNFDSLTVAEVVRKAGTSVGAFYGRFSDKEALLQALDIRFFENFEGRIESLMEPARWNTSSVARIIEDVTRVLVETYEQDRGLLRSLNLKARLSGDPRFRKREDRAWNELFPRLQKTILAHKREIGHPNPVLAVRLGFQQLFFTMREILLWNPLKADPVLEGEELIAELSRAYISYLDIQEERTND